MIQLIICFVFYKPVSEFRQPVILKLDFTKKVPLFKLLEISFRDDFLFNLSFASS